MLSHSSRSRSPDDSTSAANTLYCDEDAGEIVQFDSQSWISSCRPQSPSISGYSPPSDENTVSRLIDSEPHFSPLSDYLHRCRCRSVDLTARQDSINWILKLLSVACLSLAAKMEELHVPLLLDLQILEPGFVFEPKTVQRMELLVMANLNWRLRSVTPFDYLDYFISKLPSSPELEYFNRVYTASSDLILSTTRVTDFLGFAPSTMAAAAVLCAAGESFEIPAADEQLFHERINKEMVRSCLQLMQEYVIDTCPLAHLKDSTAEPPAAPPSPVGVLDAAACRSCDTCSENPSSVSQVQFEPLAKRPRYAASNVQQV